MNAQEIALLKKVIDEDLPALLSAEEARLPMAYQPIAAAVHAALVPLLIKALDEKLAEIKPA